MSFSIPKLLNKYPHMLPSDNEIWNRFLLKYPRHFDLVDYDIHVGLGIQIDPSWEPNIQSMAKALTQRRIDVIGKKGLKFFLIEVKKDPGVSSVGQLVSYRILYTKQFPSAPTPRICLVANQVDRDLRSVCEKLHIVIFVV